MFEIRQLVCGNDSQCVVLKESWFRGIERFLVFSDDMQWCQDAFKGDEYVFIRDRDYIT